MLFVSTACSRLDAPVPSEDIVLLSGEKYQEKLSEKERIELIKERRNELDSIRKWDFFAIRNNPEEALTYYLQVAERLPNDVILQKKIGHAYFLKKDWNNAYNAYIRSPIGDMTDDEKSELLTALFFDETQFDRIGELSRISTGTGKQEYYTIVDACYTGIHNCIVTIEAYTWGLDTIITLQSVIQDAEKISPDYQYRNFVVATKLYEYGEYRAASLIAREILQNRPDYAVVEKLLWFSLYEIGNYPDAKKYLLAHLERSPEDMETIARLWDIAFVQGDYLTANLYFNNAVLAWYIYKTDLERKLAYSYSRLWDNPAMLRVLAYLLEEPDSTVDDAAVAISLALERWENLKAYVWSSNAIKKYPSAPSIVALHITTMRRVGKSGDAQAYLDTLPPSIAGEPIVLLEKAILLLENQWDLTSALVVFEEVFESDPTADFALEAQNYMDFIHAKQMVTPDITDDRAQADQWRAWWQ